MAFGASRIEQLLNSNQGVDVTVRGDAYCQTGWTGFDDTAAPYTAEEVTRERATYGEGPVVRAGGHRGDG